MNEDFLALGLDQAAALLHRWGKTTNFNKGMTSKALLAMNPTPAGQRAFCATFPALISYFDTVQHPEGLGRPPSQAHRIAGALVDHPGTAEWK